jgi:hypothetical protein
VFLIIDSRRYLDGILPHASSGPNNEDPFSVLITSFGLEINLKSTEQPQSSRLDSSRQHESFIKQLKRTNIPTPIVAACSIVTFPGFLKARFSFIKN